jgi:hypothetical protein
MEYLQLAQFKIGIPQEDFDKVLSKRLRIMIHCPDDEFIPALNFQGGISVFDAIQAMVDEGYEQEHGILVGFTEYVLHDTPYDVFQACFLQPEVTLDANRQP